MLLEIACDSLQSARNAQAGGATRIELCDNLAQGGITPSYGKIKLAKQQLDIPVFVLIRPRKGDFLYSELEFELMLEDIRVAKDLGADGIVSGILQADGCIDVERTKAFVKTAEGMHFSFHRAFDMCCEAAVALEQLIDLGIDTILTSGQAANVLDGEANLRQYVQQAAGRIQIMAGGGLRIHNVEQVAKTGVRAFHSSAKHMLQSKMQYRGNTKMGDESVQEEFQWAEVSSELVSALRAALDKC